MQVVSQSCFSDVGVFKASVRKKPAIFWRKNDHRPPNNLNGRMFVGTGTRLIMNLLSTSKSCKHECSGAFSSCLSVRFLPQSRLTQHSRTCLYSKMSRKLPIFPPFVAMPLIKVSKIKVKSCKLCQKFLKQCVFLTLKRVYQQIIIINICKLSGMIEKEKNTFYTVTDII